MMVPGYDHTEAPHLSTCLIRQRGVPGVCDKNLRRGAPWTTGGPSAVTESPQREGGSRRGRHRDPTRQRSLLSRTPTLEAEGRGQPQRMDQTGTWHPETPESMVALLAPRLQPRETRAELLIRSGLEPLSRF